MPLVFACMVPHAGVALPELAENPAIGALTRQAMAAIGDELALLAPETVVILTPHGVTIHGAIGVAITEQAAGTLGPVAVEMHVDQELAFALADRGAQAGLPVLPYWFGDGRLPLDWSTIVPMRFLGARFQPRPRLVVVGPSPSVPRHQLVAFGQELRAAAEASPRRVALVASVDQGHAHSASGPYGYDPASALFDAMLREMLAEGRLDKLIDLDEELEAAALPDSVQSLLVLHGALGARPCGCDLRSYEVYGYFGGICATFDLMPAVRPAGSARRQAGAPAEG